MEGLAQKFLRAEKFRATQTPANLQFFLSNNSIPLNKKFVRRIQNLFKRLEICVSQKILTCTGGVLFSISYKEDHNYITKNSTILLLLYRRWAPLQTY